MFWKTIDRIRRMSKISRWKSLSNVNRELKDSHIGMRTRKGVSQKLGRGEFMVGEGIAG